MEPKTIVVSCCFLAPTRYDGTSKPFPAVKGLLSHLQKLGFSILPLCPEQLGGLPTPRIPSEQQGAYIRNQAGEDVTNTFQIGAQTALELALFSGATVALLKQNSPSCGSGFVYDGTFTGTLQQGDGITTALFRAHGISVFSEQDIATPACLEQALFLPAGSLADF